MQLCIAMELNTPQDIQTEAEAKGLSISEMCRAAGVARTTFQRALNGSTTLTLGTCKKLIDAINSAEHAE